jgi:CRP-like cAMP-binding protein
LQTAELSNNIQPTNNGEIIFVMLLQLIGAIVFGFIIGTVGTILMSWGLLEERISRKLAELREFMNEKNVPKATRKKVKKFMEDYYRSKAGYDETEVVSALPPAIAVELLDSIYRGTLLKVPIFRHLDEDVICRICLLMKPMTVAKGEYVFNEKDRGREMYIIREGRIQIMRYGMTIGVLHKHCFFGEDCMMAVEPGKKNYRQRTAFAIEDCELAFLRATDADKIALDYPEMLSSFQDLAAKKACVEHERLNMMINQVADELGVDPDSSVMDDVLTAVSTIASEDDVISMEVRAARKIANWWRHTKRRKQGLVKEKFPPVLDMIEERDDDTALKSKIRYALLCFILCAGLAWPGLAWPGLAAWPNI